MPVRALIGILALCGAVAGGCSSESSNGADDAGPASWDDISDLHDGDGSALDDLAAAERDITLPLEVDGTRVGPHSFGSWGDAVVADMASRLGNPSQDSGWVAFTSGSQIDGGDAERFYRDAEGDALGDAWDYQYWREVCWELFCIELGGDTADDGALRGWAMSSILGDPVEAGAVPVVIAGTDITLGSRWEDVQAAFPSAVAAGGEGNSLVVRDGPFEGIFDGAGAWRLSGTWDDENPAFAPADAQVTRLSGGEGPEPGCC